MSFNFFKNPYLRLARVDRPIGSVLLTLPCLWGIALCYKHEIFGKSLFWAFVFIVGAFLLRSAGCIINDIFDADFDKYVARTKNRPLANGELSKKQAFFALFVCLALGLLVFLLLNNTAKIISFIGLGISIIYPLAKRFFPFPQFVLGLAFNIGVLVAVAQLQEDFLFTPTPWILYVAGIFWTLYYDTVYAMQDIRDDIKLGIHSTALFFKNHLKLMLSICYGGVIMMMFALGYTLNVGFQYYFWTSIMCVDAYFTLKKMNTDQPNRGGFYFIRSALVGVEVLGNILFFT